MASSEKPENIKLTVEQLASCEEAFATFDKHALGTINIRECGNAMRSIGQNPTDQDLQDMCNEYVADSQGNIEFPEFTTMMGILFKKADTEDEYKQAFRVFSGQDADGYFLAQELREVLENIGERPGTEEIDDIVCKMDPDHDGKIWYEDFVHLMKGSSSGGASDAAKSADGTAEKAEEEHYEVVETAKLVG